MQNHYFISTFLWSICIWFLSYGTAFANDPFAILFGEEQVRTSTTNDAGRESVIILRMKIRHHLVSKDWLAHDLADGLCLPVQTLADALELPLTLENGVFNGAAIGELSNTQFDTYNNSDFVKTDQGWCGFEPILESLFPIDIDYRPSNLELIITPKLSLPIDARLAREEARKILKNEEEGSQTDYRAVENPYRAVSFPTLDFTFDTSLNAAGDKTMAANISGAADLLWMNAHFQTSANLEEQFSSNRLRLFRDNSQAEELSLLKARRFALGDVSSRSQPLIGRSQSGRGVFVSNQSLYKPELFDETIIRGKLPEGWDAELFDNDVLIDFITEPDQNGDYIFKNVPLRPGYNHLTVKLYGPYGEGSERHITQFVGTEHCPNNEWKYSFGVIDPTQAFLGEMLFTENDNDNDDINALNESDPSKTPSAFLSLEHGLSQNLTLRSDLNISDTQSLLSTSLVSSVWGGYGVGRLALDDKGHMAWQLNYQKRISNRTSFSAKGASFGNLKSTVNGFGDNRILTQMSARLDTRLNLGRHILPLQTDVSYNSRASHISDYNAKLRVAGSVKRLKWSNALRYSLLSQPNSYAHNIQGELLGSYSLSDIKLRTAANYSFADGFSLDNLSLSARKSFNKSSQIQASVLYDMKTKAASFETAFTRSFKKVSLQTRAKLGSNKNWALGIGLAFSLFQDENSKKYRFAKPGLSRSGVIAPRIFDDLNNNGVFDQGDMALEGAQFIIENSLRSEESDASGVNVIADLSPSKIINSEIKLSSIEDPFLRPLEIGRSVELRAGQVLGYDVPLTASGEIEGTILVQNKENTIPVAGITLEAVNEVGQIVGKAKTEYDGYFYLEDIPGQTLTLKISDKDLASIDGNFAPLTVSLSRKYPSKLGISLTIKREMSSL